VVAWREGWASTDRLRGRGYGYQGDPDETMIGWGKIMRPQNISLSSSSPSSSCLWAFAGVLRVPRPRVEIFSDGVYAASATGLMIELLNRYGP
jgi:hypothetical protein